MKSCCIEAGEAFFKANYPFAFSAENDALAAYLLQLRKQWGPITSFGLDQFYIRSTSSSRLGVDAKTGNLRCLGECGGSVVPYIFIGARLFSFIWRINMICGTAWASGEASKLGLLNLTPATDWPRKEHIEQVKIAFDMYFGDNPFLSTQGLAEFNQQIFGSAFESALLHTYIVDLAELFVLFHEIQHQVPISQLGPKPMGVTVRLPSDIEISDRRARWWVTELTHDANSLWLLLLSATAALHDRLQTSLDDARTQAASLVCTGADAALATLQCIEELRYGKVNLNVAATMKEFTRHPPTQFRRDMLAQASYTLITGKDISSLYRREFTESWRIVAQNVASHMKIRERLLAKYLNESA